jgi:hypothetical protein
VPGVPGGAPGGPPGGPAGRWPADEPPTAAGGWRRVPTPPDPPREDLQAWLDRLDAEGEPPDPDLWPDPDDPPLPGEIDPDAIAVECAELAAGQADAAARAARVGGVVPG